MYDDLSEIRFSDDDALNADARWTTLFVHGREVAIEEGILVPLHVPFGRDTVEVCFTDKLCVKYNGSQEVLEPLAQEGLRLLSKPQPEDTDDLRRRLMAREDILVVQDRDGISLMTPDDWGD